MSRYKQPYSLYKRGKYWYYRTYDDRGIRTTAISTGKTSKAAAQTFCDALFKAGELWQSNKTFYEYAAHFYDDNRPYLRDRVEPLSENTIKGLRVKMTQYILPYFGSMKLANIKYTDLKQFRIKMLENYAPSNVIQTMSCLKHIFDAAFRDREITVNPFEYLEPLAAKQNNRDAFTLEEITKLYNLIGPEFQNIVLLMALTGLRISEAVGVRPEDIKTEGDIIYIDLKEQLNNQKRKPLKNKECRQIPVIPEVKELIGFEPTRLAAFYRLYNKVKLEFPNAVERQLSFHSLRHFFITNAKSCGVISAKVETIAGHSLRGMEKVYTNFKVEDLTDILPWQLEIFNKIKRGAAAEQ